MKATASGILILLSLSLPSSGDETDKDILSFNDSFDAIRKIAIPIDIYYIPVNSISELCRNHSNYLLDRFLKSETWALKMVDASSKLPSGVMDGHIMDFGSFDQCLSIVAPGELFRGQNCIVSTKGLLPDKFDDLNKKRSLYPSFRVDITFSVCVPSTCSFQDVMAHMNVSLNSFNASAIMEENSCTTSIPDPLTTGEWVSIIVIVLLALLTCVATIYDVKDKKDKNAYISAFSLKANIKEMLSTETKPETITCLNGLRVMAFCWVMLFHRTGIKIEYPNIRSKSTFEKMSTIGWAPLVNGVLSVEIFFFMTGLLVIYGYLRDRKQGKQFNLLRFYLLRYLRMTPALALSVMIMSTIANRFTDGPYWKVTIGLLQTACQNTWYNVLLYTTNYIQTEGQFQCMIQLWYLSADFQMYIFSPLLLIPFHKKPKLGLVLSVMFLLLTTAAALWNAYSLDLRAGGAYTADRRTEETLRKDYFPSHVRAASFIIGVAMGFLLFKVKEGHIILNISKINLWAGWLTSIFLILFSVLFVNHFQQAEYEYNKWLEVSYQVFHRHLFILGISWIVLVCALGHGGVVDQFLSWKLFIPLGHLTYSAFLVHLMLQIMFSFNSRTVESTTNLSLWHQFFGDLLSSYLCATVLFLLVERPFINIVNLMFKGEKKDYDLSQLTEIRSSKKNH